MREQREDCFLLEGAVDAALDGLLEDHRRPVGSKVVRKLLYLLPVQVGPSVCLLVDVNADWYGEETGGLWLLKDHSFFKGGDWHFVSYL